MDSPAPIMSTRDIAGLLRIPVPYVNNIAKACSLHPQMMKTKDGRKNFYTDDDYKIIKHYLHHKFRARTGCNVEIPEQPLDKRVFFGKRLIEGKTIEEWKEEHPLVQDERFFKTSYFPDVTIDD